MRLTIGILLVERKRIDRRAYLKTAGFIVAVGAGLAAAYSLWPISNPPPRQTSTVSVTHTLTETTIIPSTVTSGTTTTGVPTITDLFNFAVTEDLPNELRFEVDYSYGPDKQPAKFNDRPVGLVAKVATPDFLGALSLQRPCDQETKRGRASMSVRICILPKKQTSTTSLETNEIRILMFAECRAGERFDDCVFFEKGFYYHKIWRDIEMCPIY